MSSSGNSTKPSSSGKLTKPSSGKPRKPSSAKPKKPSCCENSKSKSLSVASTAAAMGMLSMGPGTHEIPLELFELNRSRLVERIRNIPHKNGLILLQGGGEMPFYNTDITYNVFRQESYFMWTFGVIEPGCFGCIDCSTGTPHLFVPRFTDSYATWKGPVHELNHFSAKYGINSVHYVDEIETVVKDINPATVLTLKGLNTDSGLTLQEATFKGISKFNVNHKVLFNEMADLRVIKTDHELAVLKYVIGVSSEAHKKVMRYAAPGRMEYQCESEFLHHCYEQGGCRFVSYTCICASHTNAATLHYGHAGTPNNRMINEGEMCLFDMGANYFGYCSDITCTFPVSGKFTPDQRLIYEAVLEANLFIQKTAKPGVLWADMHLLAAKTLLTKLEAGGLVSGNVDEMVAVGLGGIFQPHGLGHLLGLDVHDVGGYLPSEPRHPCGRGLSKLRTARVLKENMVITIEPGCYFIAHLLKEAQATPNLAKFLVMDVIKRFADFGGVRIEDDVVITKDGVVNLTEVPRTVDEIENWMAGK